MLTEHLYASIKRKSINITTDYWMHYNKSIKEKRIKHIKIN